MIAGDDDTDDDDDEDDDNDHDDTDADESCSYSKWWIAMMVGGARFPHGQHRPVPVHQPGLDS